MAKGTNENEASQRKEEEAVMLIIIALVVAWALYSGVVNFSGKSSSLTDAAETEMADPVPPASPDDLKPKTVNRLSVGDTVRYAHYPQNRGWSGVITAMESENCTVRIISVNTGAPLIYSLYPSECTGKQKIGPSSVGHTVIVPVACFE